MINFRSKLRRELFCYYFTNPAASHYLRELAQRLAADPANLSRELASLEQQGLFVSETRGRQKYFRLNRRHPLYQDYRRIVFKTVGVAGRLREVLARTPGVQQAFLYGSFARDQADAVSDIDLFIVGLTDDEQLETAIGKIERQLHREVNYVLMTPREFKTRLADKDAFLEDVFRHSTVTLLPAP